MADSSTGFAYEAQTPTGQALSGFLQAADLPAARMALEGLGLRVLALAAEAPPRAPRALRGEDFLAFNQQLAYLTAAGLPVEQGLKLIGQDLRSGRLAGAVQQVVGELDRGVALPEAFARHTSFFPPLYARLVQAGIKTNNLPAMLFNLGRHLELINRIRGTLWRTAAYPLMVLLGLTVVLTIVSTYILPQFRAIFADFGTSLPLPTTLLLWAGPYMFLVGLGLLVVVFGPPLLWAVLRPTGADRVLTDVLLLPLPILGPILRRNLVARWCDALRLGVEAGLDLPAAIALAGDAVGSPKLSRDSRALVACLEAGRSLDARQATAILPATVLQAIDLGAQNRDMPNVLDSLARMYQEQAEHRLGLLPAVLTPFLLIVVAFSMGFGITALFLPLVKLVQSVSGGP